MSVIANARNYHIVFESGVPNLAWSCLYPSSTVPKDLILHLLGRQEAHPLPWQQDRQHQGREVHPGHQGGVRGDEEVLCKLTTSGAQRSDCGHDFRAIPDIKFSRQNFARRTNLLFRNDPTFECSRQYFSLQPAPDSPVSSVMTKEFQLWGPVPSAFHYLCVYSWFGSLYLPFDSDLPFALFDFRSG